MNNLIIIAGPTGVGKSDIAELLASKIDAEIINADQAQLYEPLCIGTAKPDWKNKSIRHHLFDLITVPRHCSNAEYQKALHACIQEIHGRGKKAVVVGGSGFYFQMLLYDFIPLPEPSENYDHHKKYPISWDELKRVDPIRASAIHPSDTYRIERALDIYYRYMILPSSAGLIYKPFMPYIFIHLDRTTQDLYARINMRTQEMLKDGWIQEVSLLSTAWKDFINLKKPIGYPEILQYLAGEIPYSLLVGTIQQKTRNYAKRQRTYFRTIMKKLPPQEKHAVHEINLTLSSVDLYLNQLIQLINRTQDEIQA